MRTIDGSHGEGGGQLVRMAVALAAICGEAVEVHNIRARRTPPGLAPQHMTAVQAVAALCDAEVEGLQVHSQALRFRPGPLRGGHYRFDVGTAGSVTLVLQAVLPVAVMCDTPVAMLLTGGTDVRAAPPLDYLRKVFLPLLAHAGVNATLTLRRRGYYPRGGGEIEVQVRGGRPRPVSLMQPHPVTALRGVAHVANLPWHIVERMQRTASLALAGIAPVHIGLEMVPPAQAHGQGGAIVLWAQARDRFLGGAAVAERGVPAERLAQNAALALRAEIDAGATLDVHATDQILIYLALAHGTSEFLARSVSSHAETTLWLLRQFFPLDCRMTAEGACSHVVLTRS